jgi:hypothetical protein
MVRRVGSVRKRVVVLGWRDRDRGLEVVFDLELDCGIG